MKTIDDIRARIRELGDGRCALIPTEMVTLMGYVREELKPGYEPDVLTEPEVVVALKRAVDKGYDRALAHKGLSSTASNMEIRGLLWILGDDEAYYVASDVGKNQNYWVPVLKYVARRYDMTLPALIEHWEDGKKCNPRCMAGCQ